MSWIITVTETETTRIIETTTNASWKPGNRAAEQSPTAIPTGTIL